MLESIVSRFMTAEHSPDSTARTCTVSYMDNPTEYVKQTRSMLERAERERDRAIRDAATGLPDSEATSEAVWQPVPGTANLHLPEQDGLPLRHIVVREPRFGEPDGTKYVVSGPGHGESVHASLAEAKTAAEASQSAF